MTNPTASNPLIEESGPRVRLGHPVANTVQTFAGGFAALAGSLAVATPGFAVNYDNLVGIGGLGGQWSDEVTGDTSQTPDLENNADGSGRILKNVAVTGVVDNPTDLLKAVFADSAGPPLLLADPGNSVPFGVIVNVTGAGTADVWQFGLEAMLMWGVLSRTVYDAGAGGGDFTSWGTNAGNP